MRNRDNVKFSSECIRRVWREYVFNDPRILDFTDQIHEEDFILNDDSNMDLFNKIKSGSINYIQWMVQRVRSRDSTGGCFGYDYRVRIDYVLEHLYKESTQNQIQDFFECLDEVVLERLGLRWRDTVFSSRPDTRFPNIIPQRRIDERFLMSGTFDYFAEIENIKQNLN